MVRSFVLISLGFGLFGSALAKGVVDLNTKTWDKFLLKNEVVMVKFLSSECTGCIAKKGAPAQKSGSKCDACLADLARYDKAAEQLSESKSTARLVRVNASEMPKLPSDSAHVIFKNGKAFMNYTGDMEDIVYIMDAVIAREPFGTLKRAFYPFERKCKDVVKSMTFLPVKVSEFVLSYFRTIVFGKFFLILSLFVTMGILRLRSRRLNQKKQTEQASNNQRGRTAQVTAKAKAVSSLKRSASPAVLEKDKANELASTEQSAQAQKKEK